jgi:hypothetical protein
MELWIIGVHFVGLIFSHSLVACSLFWFFSFMPCIQSEKHENGVKQIHWGADQKTDFQEKLMAARTWTEL